MERDAALNKDEANVKSSCRRCDLTSKCTRRERSFFTEIEMKKFSSFQRNYSMIHAIKECSESLGKISSASVCQAKLFVNLLLSFRALEWTVMNSRFAVDIRTDSSTFPTTRASLFLFRLIWPGKQILSPLNLDEFSNIHFTFTDCKLSWAFESLSAKSTKFKYFTVEHSIFGQTS